MQDFPIWKTNTRLLSHACVLCQSIEVPAYLCKFAPDIGLSLFTAIHPTDVSNFVIHGGTLYSTNVQENSTTSLNSDIRWSNICQRSNVEPDETLHLPLDTVFYNGENMFNR